MEGDVPLPCERELHIFTPPRTHQLGGSEWRALSARPLALQEASDRASATAPAPAKHSPGREASSTLSSGLPESQRFSDGRGREEGPGRVCCSAELCKVTQVLAQPGSDTDAGAVGRRQRKPRGERSPGSLSQWGQNCGC